MTRKALEHNESYEWTGLFWFPENEENKFSGTVTYSPESGIQIELLTTNFLSEDNLNRKLVYGAVTGDVTNSITLINVSLNLGTMHFGQTSVRVISGTAEYLLQGFMVDELTFDSIHIQYEEQLENIFFRPVFRERDILAYENSEISPGEGIKISMSLNSQGTGVYSEHDIDTIFWSHNEEKFKEFKASMAKFLEDKSLKLFKRTSLFSTFKIEKPESTLRELCSIEEQWRSFWELLLDQELLSGSIWLKVPYQREGDDKICTEMVPILRNHYKSIKRNKKRSATILQHLAININSFGGPRHALSVVNPAMTWWLQRKNDPSWNPVIYGVTRILKRKRQLAETPHYISLLAEIQTFLNLLNKEPENLDTLINQYATDEWKNSLSEILPLQGDTLGKFLSDIRNAIVHPKGADLKYKRQLPIIQEINLFQKVFAYLAGLYVQAFLQEMGSISDDSIQKYIKQFIDFRGSWHTPEYT